MLNSSTVRDKAIARLSNAVREVTRRARLARSKRRLSDITTQRQSVLRDIGHGVGSAGDDRTSLRHVLARWDPLWIKLVSLTDRQQIIKATIEEEQAGTGCPTSTGLPPLRQSHRRP